MEYSSDHFPSLHCTLSLLLYIPMTSFTRFWDLWLDCTAMLPFHLHSDNALKPWVQINNWCVCSFIYIYIYENMNISEWFGPQRGFPGSNALIVMFILACRNADMLILFSNWPLGCFCPRHCPFSN